MNKLKIAIATGISLLGLGCASSPVPADQMASAEASLRAAQELGAQRVPRAELHMRLAREQVVTARKLSADGENERAALVLTRARADAELAIAIVREATAHGELEAATRRESSAATPSESTTQAAR
jgi:hypothetical protein